jgi:hypothetical protein
MARDKRERTNEQTQLITNQPTTRLLFQVRRMQQTVRQQTVRLQINLPPTDIVNRRRKQEINKRFAIPPQPKPAQQSKGKLPTAESPTDIGIHEQTKKVPLPRPSFPQAHLIQGKIKLQYEQELNAWNNDKQNKI